MACLSVCSACNMGNSIKATTNDGMSQFYRNGDFQTKIRRIFKTGVDMLMESTACSGLCDFFYLGIIFGSD